MRHLRIARHDGQWLAQELLHRGMGLYLVVLPLPGEEEDVQVLLCP